MTDLRNELDIDLPRCRGAFLEDAPEEIWGNPDWCLEPKECGDRVSLQLGSKKSLMRGRNRQDFLKGVDKAGEFRDLSYMNPAMSAITCKSLDGTILDGELTEIYNQSGRWTETTKTIAENGGFVGYTVWTVLFVRWQDVRNFSEKLRYELTKLIVSELNQPKIRLVLRVPASKQFMKNMFDAGEEGVVLKKLDGIILHGSRTCSTWWKVKNDKDRTVDAFIVGVQEGKSGGSGKSGIKPKPNGKAATFTVAMMKDGKIVEVGKMSNLPDGVKEKAWKLWEMAGEGKRFRWPFWKRVVEMRVSGWDGKRFRYPRFVKFRPDKSPVDCVFSEQVKGGK